MNSANNMNMDTPFGFVQDETCPCCFSPGVPFGSSRTCSVKLKLLRSEMSKLNLSAYLVGSADAHGSEYVSECDERRSYLTGFSGSAGEALVTQDGAYLWTDSRYYLQVARQLSKEWTLMKQESGVIDVMDFLSQLNDGVMLNAYLHCEGDSFCVVRDGVHSSSKFKAFLKEQDAVLLGRKTYDWLVKEGGGGGWPFGDLPVFVLTRRHRDGEALEGGKGIAVGRVAADMEDVISEIRGKLAPGSKNVYVEGLNIVEQMFDSDMLSGLKVVTLEGGGKLGVVGSGDLMAKLKKVECDVDGVYDFRAEMPAARVGVWSPGFGSGRAEHFKEGWAKTEVKRKRVGDQYNAPLLVPMAENLVDGIWDDRPEIPQKEIRVMKLELAGEAVESKIERVMASVKEAGCTATVINALDQIAWLFNLRGSDIVCNPVFFSYAALTERGVTLFVGRARGCRGGGVSEEVKRHLRDANVDLRDYSEWEDLSTILKEGEFVLVENESCSLGVVEAVENAGGKVVKSDGGYCVSLFKAKKNEAEIEGCRRACLIDAAAVVKFLAWLEVEGEGKKEAEMADILETYRVSCGGDSYLGVSFDTISSVGENSAVIHYKPEAGSDNERALEVGEEGFVVYLLDSGGQYDDGTTDVTRTVVFGEPSSEVKAAYTAVLQGHLNLASMKFPKGTCGLALDAMARAPLWAKGLDYGHGTGHGIGAGLNVHEGPFGISGSSKRGDLLRKNARGLFMVLEPINEGYFMSNEPGYYKDGAWGIRIESDMVSKVWKEEEEGGGKTFLEFENLTWVPMCRKLIDFGLLNSQEKEWVNWFQSTCREKLEGLLGDDQRAVEWLRRETEAMR
ncbi:hypothetical protein TrVE_jg5775 [Triparma verrucosa]|uniref:Uncharacterized protein n=1 Tax=Triparma verrucosa TaxID=1606542 RepID=A0A9W7BQN0_9STRA|nr:hypothetical protein TrVE_jg5775 [Triparma verrucosa]